MNMCLAFHTGDRCMGVRIGDTVVPEDVLCNMGDLIKDKISWSIKMLMDNWLFDGTRELNFKKTAFFYAKMYVEHYKPFLQANQQLEEWNKAVVKVMQEMQEHEHELQDVLIMG